MAGNRIFISYARPDSASARRLYVNLRDADLDPWLDEVDLFPGSQWRPAIETAIEQSRFFIALLSSQSVGRRGFVNKELMEALDVLDTYPQSQVFLIPARIDSCEPPHRRLRDINWVDLFPDWNRGVARIIAAVGGEEASQPNLGPLRIDDVIAEKGCGCINFDVRLRNAGTEPVNVTRADLHVLERVPYAAAYKASASYDLILEGDHNSIAIAHVLQPNEVDRFVIRVGFSKWNTSCGFDAELILAYNGGYEARSKPFRFASIF